MASLSARAKRTCQPRKKSFLDISEQEGLMRKVFGGNHVVSKKSLDEGKGVDVDEQESRSAPIWHDRDDLEGVVQLPSCKIAHPLKRKVDRGEYVTTDRTPKWAKLDSERRAKKMVTDSEDEIERTIEEMTRSTQRYIDKGLHLRAGFISTFRWPDITVGHRDTKPINVILFHKTRPVVAAAGNTGKVQLFKVSDTSDCENFLQSVKFSNYPVTSMFFLKEGVSVICGSSRQVYFMQYDLNNGTVMQINLPKSVPSQNVGRFTVSYDGSLVAVIGHSSQVYVLSAKSMELLNTFSAPSNVTSLQFLPGSSQELWAITECGEVVIWDLRSSFQHVRHGVGALRGTALRISTDGTKAACGSNSGVINVFDVASIRKSSFPKPVITVSNLVTSSDSLAFSHDSELMAFSSKVKKNHIRLLHVSSQTVFKNFPRKNEKITRIECTEFSPHSAYLGIGCSDGQLILDRISHYENY